MSGPFQVGTDQLSVLRCGAAFFPALCAAIEAARHSVYLETYIFADDEAGHAVAAALAAAAARGVVVRLMLDGFGSADLPETRVEALRAAGIEIQWFRRERGFFSLRRSRLRRLHRKLAAVDGECAFVGGINILDDVPREAGLIEPRLDYAVQIRGPLAGHVQAVMRRLWGTVSWANLRRQGRRLRVTLAGAHRPAEPRAVELLLRDSLRHRREIERAYLRAIAAAQHEVLIANAYFLPGRTFLRALIQAARRGVRVVLILQGRVEYRVQHHATRALYPRLQAAGVEIFEYQPSFLHAKVAVVDGHWATVGSSNIDPFSLLLAREANVVVQHAAFASALREELLAVCRTDCVPVGLRSAGLFERALARLSYAAIRLLMSVAGIGRRNVRGIVSQDEKN